MSSAVVSPGRKVVSKDVAPDSQWKGRDFMTKTLMDSFLWDYVVRESLLSSKR
jgi:hypothetical protein